MGHVFYFDWELSYLVWLQQLGAGTVWQRVLEFVNQCFSAFGEEDIIFLIFAVLYWGIDKEKGKRIGFAMMFAFVSNSMIKNVACRVRPYQSTDKIHLLREVKGYSFPSGHSSSAAAFYTGLADTFRKQRKKWLTAVALALPLCVAFSRNYLGAHWPTDVLAGLLLGYVMWYLIGYWIDRLHQSKIIYGILIVLAMGGIFYCKTEDYFTGLGMLLGVYGGSCFEERFVKFENTRQGLRIFLRVLFGMLVFIIVNGSLRYLFDVASGELVEHLLRSVRYMIVFFVLIGVYPMCFRIERKWVSNREKCK